jgi:hypothetical protein
MSYLFLVRRTCNLFRNSLETTTADRERGHYLFANEDNNEGSNEVKTL